MLPGGTSVLATGSPIRITRSASARLSTASANARRTRASAKGLNPPPPSVGRQLKL